MIHQQAWVYEHFPTLRGGPPADDYIEALPRAHRWTPRREASDVDAQIVYYRRLLDDISVRLVRV